MVSTSELLKKYHIRPKKSLGQNFLIAEPTLRKIIDHCDLQKNDMVVEIGSGLGIMTAMLAERCHQVIAVEKDPGLFEVAKTEFGYIKNIAWVNKDILEIDFHPLHLREFPKNAGDTALIAEGPLGGDGDDAVAGPAFFGNSLCEEMKIVGNIPYEITSPLLFKLLDHAPCISSATLLMQKEVAQRIVAQPGRKTYGILSVALQAAATCSKRFDVSPANFFPQPEVTSSLIHLSFKEGENTDLAWFRSVVRAAFGKRRKTLRNALLGSNLTLSVEDLDAALAACRIVPTRRPETLTIQEYLDLAAALRKRG